MRADSSLCEARHPGVAAPVTRSDEREKGEPLCEFFWSIRLINKGSTSATDREAIRLLRRHGILSMAAYAVGFEEETDGALGRGLRQLLSYDPDQIQLVYATPHRWTPYFYVAADRRVIQTDLAKWDYKHQVLATRRIPAWRMLLWVKFIEAVMQLRPRALWRVLAHPDPALRAAMKWYHRIGRKVWPYEIRHFIFRDCRCQNGPTLAEFWTATKATEAHALISAFRRRRTTRGSSSRPMALPA